MIAPGDLLLPSANIGQSLSTTQAVQFNGDKIQGNYQGSGSNSQFKNNCSGIGPRGRGRGFNNGRHHCQPYGKLGLLVSSVGIVFIIIFNLHPILINKARMFLLLVQDKEINLLLRCLLLQKQ